MGALPEQASPEVQRRLTRAEAVTRARERARKGELVHLSDPTGSVRVQLPGSFAWQKVGKEGLTMHAGPPGGGARGFELSGKVSVAPGGQVTARSKSRGEQVISGKSGQVLLGLSASQPREAGKRDRMEKLEVPGLVRKGAAPKR